MKEREKKPLPLQDIRDKAVDKLTPYKKTNDNTTDAIWDIIGYGILFVVGTIVVLSNGESITCDLWEDLGDKVLHRNDLDVDAAYFDDDLEDVPELDDLEDLDVVVFDV